MEFYIVKNDNKNTFDIRVDISGVQHSIGVIEKPYREMEIYTVTGWNHETLSKDGSFIFKDFETAKNTIINHYINEMEVLNK